ncbi:MAG: hypothetical protein MUE81_10085, partial [Thermoflexibacter sp.]|nr:hypothetical protein [Thermoflexibacter sp.]
FQIIVKQSDTHLEISHIGYENKVLSLDSLSKISSAGLFIELKEKIVQLPEFVVNERKAKDILLKAIENIDKNYYQRPKVLRGFYRESAIEDDSLFYFVESILGIYKQGYLSYRGYGPSVYADLVNIDESLYIDFNKKSRIDFKITHGVYNSLQCDYVLSRQFALHKKILKKLNIEFKNLTWYNGREVYEISFEDLEKAKERWSGKVFIDTESYAIIYMETTLLTPIKFRDGKTKIEITATHTRTFYRPYKGKWVLSYIFAEQTEKRTVKKNTVALDLFSELTISDIQEYNPATFDLKDTYKTEEKKSLEKYSQKYDSTYWKAKNYKIIDSDLLHKVRGSAKNAGDVIGTDE